VTKLNEYATIAKYYLQNGEEYVVVGKVW